MWFREGIHPRVPEGSSWEEVEVPKEVAQLSAGPSDLLWAVLWDGNLLVRKGLSLDSPSGQPQRPVFSLHLSGCSEIRPDLTETMLQARRGSRWRLRVKSRKLFT